MKNNDFMSVLDANSFIIDSKAKVGKVTFVSYLITALFKDKALIFTPQESFLFKRRLDSLSEQFLQFKSIKEIYSPYYLKEDWHTLKQRYGYTFFLQELEHIIVSSEEKIIVLHRVAEYFEFQDRYEIENIYKSLIKLAILHEKKIIFLVNSGHENYEYISNVAQEFTDVLISMSVNEKSERIINIKNVLHNHEYPPMNFKINKGTFLFDYYQKSTEITQNRTKNVLIAELDKADDNLRDICSYIFDKPNFKVKYANSLQTILQEIFVSPDLIIIMMKRTQSNLETIRSINMQLPDSPIVTILDQNFVRGEDAQEAYTYGCDELFSNEFSLEKLILALQKASKTLFYTQEMGKLPKYNNIMESLQELKNLAQSCMKHSIFFTLFVFDTHHDTNKISKISRHNDYIYQSNEKLYYLAISTVPKDVKNLLKQHSEYELECIWEPINHTSLEVCFQ